MSHDRLNTVLISHTVVFQGVQSTQNKESNFEWVTAPPWHKHEPAQHKYYPGFYYNYSAKSQHSDYIYTTTTNLPPSSLSPNFGLILSFQRPGMGGWMLQLSSHIGDILLRELSSWVVEVGVEATISEANISKPGQKKLNVPYVIVVLF